MSDQPERLEDDEPAIPGVTMDVFRLSVPDWYAHNRVISDPAVSDEDKVNHWAHTFARVVTRAPKAWGDPADPQLYLTPAKVNFVIFQELISLFYGQIEREQKKLKTKSTTA